jgi:hypothetical protein
VRFVDIAEDVIMWRNVSALALPAPHQQQIFTPLPIIIGHYLSPYHASFGGYGLYADRSFGRFRLNFS